MNRHRQKWEVYHPDVGWRSLPGATSEEAYGDDYNKWFYPRAWVAPDSRVFVMSGPRMFYLDPQGLGSIDFATATLSDNIGATSTAVMYRPGKILQVGGGSHENHIPVDPNSPIDPKYFPAAISGSQAATIVDINGANPIVADAAPMNFRRHWANSTVLPDGNVLVTGGSTTNIDDDEAIAAEAVRQAEIWHPETNEWKVVAPEDYIRFYHSTAILLPDATVLSAGGGAPGPQNNRNGQVYYPPYLYRGANLAPRPAIDVANNELDYNATITLMVTTDAGSPIDRVTLVKMGSVTHSFNNEQRFMELDFTSSRDRLIVETPLSNSIATPGYYMLFAINAVGTPSVAEIVHFAPRLPRRGPARQQLVQNGGFEAAGVLADGGNMWGAYPPGRRIGPWYVFGSTVDVQDASDMDMGLGGSTERRHLDLNPHGGVRQDIPDLQFGRTYTLSFDVKAHAHLGPGDTTAARVSIGSWSTSLSVSNQATWEKSFHRFVAERSGVLAIQGLGSASDIGGVLIDNVRIDAGALADGGFETPRIPYGGYLDFDQVGDHLGGWRLDRGSASVHSNHHSPTGEGPGLGSGGATGNNHIDVVGRLSQQLHHLVAGRAYLLSFDYAVHTLAGGMVSTTVSFGGEPLESWTATNLGTDTWLTKTYLVSPNAEMTELSIDANSANDFAGLLLDNVSLHPIEEVE